MSGHAAGRDRWAWVSGLYLCLFGAVFVVIGMGLLGRQGTLPSDRATLLFARMFGLREIFLGGTVILLVVRREASALRTFLLAALALPVADTLAQQHLIGPARAALGNLPYEIPLLLAVLATTRLPQRSVTAARAPG